MTLSSTALAAFAAASAQTSASSLANGFLELLDVSGVVLASFNLGAPTSSGSVTTMSGFPKTSTSSAGTIASARYRTSAGGAWKSGMDVGVAGSAAQVIVSSLTFLAGQSVSVLSATLTHSVA